MAKNTKPAGGSRGKKQQRSTKPGADLPRSTQVPRKRSTASAAEDKPAKAAKAAAKPATRPASKPVTDKPKAKKPTKAQLAQAAHEREVLEKGMSRLIIIGSPRSNGRSANLAHLLFESCIEECPLDELALAPVSELNIQGCIGCGFCAREWPGDATDVDPYLPPVDKRCALRDDMRDIYEFADTADELIVVSPVYFGGAPSQMKAVLDRLQPYFCARARRLDAGLGLVPKRPAILHVVGEGGDPYGFDALITSMRSALACAGFRLQTVFDWVGRISPDGEIQAEADCYELVNNEFVLAYSGEDGFIDDDSDDGFYVDGVYAGAADDLDDLEGDADGDGNYVDDYFYDDEGFICGEPDPDYEEDRG